MNSKAKEIDFQVNAVLKNAYKVNEAYMCKHNFFLFTPLSYSKKVGFIIKTGAFMKPLQYLTC